MGNALSCLVNSNAPRIPPGRPRRLNQVQGNSVVLFPNSLGLFPNSSTPRLALFPNSSTPRLALFPNSFTLFPNSFVLFPNSFTLFPNSFGVIPELVCPYSRTPFPYSRTRLVLFLYPNSSWERLGSVLGGKSGQHGSNLAPSWRPKRRQNPSWAVLEASWEPLGGVM